MKLVQEGDIVHLWYPCSERPLAAMVSKVNSSNNVNLGVLDPEGIAYGVTGVEFSQEVIDRAGIDELAQNVYCTWPGPSIVVGVNDYQEPLKKPVKISKKGAK